MSCFRWEKFTASSGEGPSEIRCGRFWACLNRGAGQTDAGAGNLPVPAAVGHAIGAGDAASRDTPVVSVVALAMHRKGLAAIGLSALLPESRRVLLGAGELPRFMHSLLPIY